MLDNHTERLIRLHIADPDNGEHEPLLSFDDLATLHTGAGGSVPRTVAAALRTIAASEVLVSKKIVTQDLQTDGPAVAAELRALAREWDAKADVEDGVDDGFVGYIPGPGRRGRHEGEEARTWWG